MPLDQSLIVSVAQTGAVPTRQPKNNINEIYAKENIKQKMNHYVEAGGLWLRDSNALCFGLAHVCQLSKPRG